MSPLLPLHMRSDCSNCAAQCLQDGGEGTVFWADQSVRALGKNFVPLQDPGAAGYLPKAQVFCVGAH